MTKIPERAYMYVLETYLLIWQKYKRMGAVV